MEKIAGLMGWQLRKKDKMEKNEEVCLWDRNKYVSTAVPQSNQRIVSFRNIDTGLGAHWSSETGKRPLRFSLTSSIMSAAHRGNWRLSSTSMLISEKSPMLKAKIWKIWTTPWVFTISGIIHECFSINQFADLVPVVSSSDDASLPTGTMDLLSLLINTLVELKVSKSKLEEYFR